MKLSAVLLSSVCAYLLVSTSWAKPQKSPPPAAWRHQQEEEIHAVVFRRLFRDYGGRGRHAPKLLFLNVSNNGSIKALSDSLLKRLRKEFPMPIRKASDLSEEMIYGPVRDKKTGTAGVELAVRNILWKDSRHILVNGEYGRDSLFILSPVYRLQRNGSSWKVVGEITGNPPDTCVLKGRSKGHAFKLLLAKRPFRLRNHKISGTEKTEYKVDGKEAIGACENIPRSELYRFDVRVDGKCWRIPSRLWSDCFEADLKTASSKQGPPPGRHYEPWDDKDIGFVRGWLSKNGKRLVVRMSGSDGAGGYAIVWTFRRNGHHNRRVFGPP